MVKYTGQKCGLFAQIAVFVPYNCIDFSAVKAANLIKKN